MMHGQIIDQMRRSPSDPPGEAPDHPDRRGRVGRQRGADLPRPGRALAAVSRRRPCDARGVRARPAPRVGVVRLAARPHRRVPSQRRARRHRRLVEAERDHGDHAERGRSASCRGNRRPHSHSRLDLGAVVLGPMRARRHTLARRSRPARSAALPALRQLARPAVVWFGESLRREDVEAATAATACDVFVTVGTSAIVYPAAGLVHEARRHGAFTAEINLEATPASARGRCRHSGRRRRDSAGHRRAPLG